MNRKFGNLFVVFVFVAFKVFIIYYIVEFKKKKKNTLLSNGAPSLGLNFPYARGWRALKHAPRFVRV